MAKRREFSKEEVEDIVTQYKANIARRQLALKYKCTDKVIQRVLSENNITIQRMKNPGGNTRKYSINDDYFNIKNQTSNTAYILGILASDGCVASDQNQIYIELQAKDKELLEKINIELQNERPVKDYFNNSRQYANCKLYFFSKQIKNDLAQYNIIPNKTSYNNDFMENIDPKYYIDYIRGHFDGDGSIKWTNGTITWQIDSTSSKTLYHMQEVLKSYGIETKVVEKDDNSVVNLKVYRIYCYGKENGKKLYNLFYGNSNSTVSLKMQRKYEHFTELLLKYNSHETPHLKD